MIEPGFEAKANLYGKDSGGDAVLPTMIALVGGPTMIVLGAPIFGGALLAGGVIATAVGIRSFFRGSRRSEA